MIMYSKTWINFTACQMLFLVLVAGSIHCAKVTDVRLPSHLEPVNYKLDLVPFILPDNFTIRGYVEIEVVCRVSASNITLHAADLNIDNKTVEVVNTVTGDR